MKSVYNELQMPKQIYSICFLQIAAAAKANAVPLNGEGKLDTVLLSFICM